MIEDWRLGVGCGCQVQGDKKLPEVAISSNN